MFTFIPLLGAKTPCAATQSILEFDVGIKVLIDVGWDEGFQVDQLKLLIRHVPTISIILLTHATKEHLGAFAHCYKHIPLFSRIPVYATTPVIALGRALLQDIYASAPLAASIIPQSTLDESALGLSVEKSSNLLLLPPTADEIATYFSNIHPVKYSQPHQPIPAPSSPPLNGLTITAYSAGYTLGGTIWHVQHGIESVVVAQDWNQASEHVVSGAAWLGGVTGGAAKVIEHLHKPTALICGCRGSDRVVMPGGRKHRDDVLLERIRQSLSLGGTVLIPSDSSARVLELAFLLEDAWRNDAAAGKPNQDGFSLSRCKVYVASTTCAVTMRQTRSMLEWMDCDMVRAFETVNSAQDAAEPRQRRYPNKGQNPVNPRSNRAPFDFHYLKLTEKKSKILSALASPEPKVILAADSELEWGFSAEIVSRIANDPRSTIILTSRPGQTGSGQNTLGRHIWDAYFQRSETKYDGEEARDGNGLVRLQDLILPVKRVKIEKLDVDETMVFQQYLTRQKQLQGVMVQGKSLRNEKSVDSIHEQTTSSSESSDDSDQEHQGKALNASTTINHSRQRLKLSDAELGSTILLYNKGQFDWDVRGKLGRDRMFPYIARRKRRDEFGEMIRTEDFKNAEERAEALEMDPTLSAMKANPKEGKEELQLGQKRKWEEIDGVSSAGGSRLGGKAGVGAGNGPRLGGGAEGIGKRRNLLPVNHEWMVDDEDGNRGEAGPRKAIIWTEPVRFDINVTFVDFSGLHDKRSLQMIIPLIQPRKLILVGGEEQETEALAEDCCKLLGGSHGAGGDGKAHVYTPGPGEVVRASEDSNTWSVLLSEKLVKQLQWQRFRGLGVVALTGRLQRATVSTQRAASGPAAGGAGEPTGPAVVGEAGSESEGPHPKAGASTEPARVLPVLDVVPANLAVPTRSAPGTLHVGDLRLADLRRMLQAAGYVAEFRGEGSMIVEGVVAVRKAGPGRIEVESNLVGEARAGRLGTTSSWPPAVTPEQALYQVPASDIGKPSALFGAGDSSCNSNSINKSSGNGNSGLGPSPPEADRDGRGTNMDPSKTKTDSDAGASSTSRPLGSAIGLFNTVAGKAGANGHGVSPAPSGAGPPLAPGGLFPTSLLPDTLHPHRTFLEVRKRIYEDLAVVEGD